jgi:hypothetical protein
MSPLVRKPIRGVSQVQRHPRQTPVALLNGLDGLVHRIVHLWGLFRPGQIYGALGENHVALRTADQLAALHGGDGNRDRLRVPQPYVFGGNTNEPSSNEEGVLASHEHSHSPVQGSIGIRTAY